MYACAMSEDLLSYLRKKILKVIQFRSIYVIGKGRTKFMYLGFETQNYNLVPKYQTLTSKGEI